MLTGFTQVANGIAAIWIPNSLFKAWISGSCTPVPIIEGGFDEWKNDWMINNYICPFLEAKNLVGVTALIGKSNHPLK